MQIMRIILCGLSTALFLCAAGPRKPLKKARVEQKVVIIKGNQASVNTGLTVAPQDRVTITASGRVCFNPEQQSCVGPNGWAGGHAGYWKSWPYNANYCDDPLQSANHASLLADIGNTFPVGSRKTFSGKNGHLYLVINDCTLNGKFRNSGRFSVVIKVEHR